MVFIRIKSQDTSEQFGMRVLEQKSMLGNQAIAGNNGMEARLQGLLPLLKKISSGEPLAKTFDAVARFVEQETFGNSLVSIGLVEGELLQLGAAPSLPAGYAKIVYGKKLGPQCGASGLAVLNATKIVCENMATDERLNEVRELVHELGLQACFSLPVMAKNGTVLACITHYYREPQTPSPDDLMLSELAGHLIGILINHIRIESKLREKITELGNLDRQRNEFLAMLGHELRNPLSSIVSATELLRTSGDDLERRTKWIGVLDRKLSLLRQLIDGLLNITRLTQGDIGLRTANVDLCKLVESVVFSEVEIDSRLHVRLPDNPLYVSIDPDRTRQIIESILHNACKFTPLDGRIDIVLRGDNERAYLKFIDTGEGIAANVLAHVFDPFVQSPRSLDRSAGGLGIGLTLVKVLVEAQGGTVVAKSKGVGLGSEFEVQFRLEMAPGKELKTIATQPKTVSPSFQVRKILIVDDDKDAVALLATLLTHWGHEIGTAFDGLSALEQIGKLNPDIVLLDIGLPGLDGYQVAHHLRNSASESSSCVLIALTGYGQKSDELRARAAGFNEFLVKPVDLTRLRTLIDHSICE